MLYACIVGDETIGQLLEKKLEDIKMDADLAGPPAEVGFVKPAEHYERIPTDVLGRRKTVNPLGFMDFDPNLWKSWTVFGTVFHVERSQQTIRPIMKPMTASPCAPCALEQRSKGEIMMTSLRTLLTAQIVPPTGVESTISCILK